MERKLYRDESRKVIGGVCAGLADYFGVDVSIVRLIFVLALIAKGGGLMIYIILWIVLPRKSAAFMPHVDYTVPPATPYGQPSAAYQAPQPQFVPQPKKGPSTAAIIGGLILVLVGSGILIDDLDLIPDWHFDVWWPGILVIVGIALMISGSKKDKPATNYTETKSDVTDIPGTDAPADDQPKNEI